MSKKEVVIIRKLTDEELDQLTPEDKLEIADEYMKKVPYENTVQAVLEENNIKFDDLSEFVLGMDVGRCNHATRTEYHIYLNRPNSKWKDNIKINLKDGEVAPITVQIGDDEFIHEEGYDFNGFELYRT